MADWYLEREGAEGTRVYLTPVAGELTVTWDQQGGVFDTLDGSRVVWQTPASPPSVSVPDLHFSDPAEATRLRVLATSGATLILAADTGETWRVRAVGGVSVRTLDTPDRDTAPKLRVSLTLVGV